MISPGGPRKSGKPGCQATRKSAETPPRSQRAGAIPGRADASPPARKAAAARGSCPTSGLNLVERWFGDLDDKAIRRDVFRNVEDIQASIDAFLTAWIKDPKPFVRTATVESIAGKLSRCGRTLEKIRPGCTGSRSGKRKK
jgi:hypothetical protein